MSEPLDEQYLTWLYARIGSTRDRRKAFTYWNLCHQLYTKEFVWLIPNDDNRVEDGRYLRYAFLDEAGLNHVDPNWLGMGCSVLELLIGLADRLQFEADRTATYWFWQMIDNLELTAYTDAVNRTQQTRETIEETINRVIWRTYEPSGYGGLFPLREPHLDQRNVELWYQMSAYALERV